MHDKVIARLRRQIAAVLILKHALLWLAAWAFMWGTFVIVWRVATGVAAAELWLGLAAAPLLTIFAAGLALRGVPSRARLRAVVDGASGCGGLLMAAAETPLGPWRKSLPDPARLQVTWRGGQAWLAFLAGIAFLLVALLFPQSLVTLAGAAPLDITQETQQLAAQLDVLKQEAVLDPQRADFLKDRLKQLKEDASGTSPVKTLEALDHLRDIATKAAKQAAEAAVAKTEKLGQAEGLAEGIRKNDGELEPKLQKQAMAALAALVQQAAGETDLVNQHLDPELLKRLQGARLTAEQLQKLAEALKASKLDLTKMVEKLRAAKLIDIELLFKCNAAGACDCDGMLAKATGKTKSTKGGRGGVTEGGGSSPITWSHDTKEDSTKFKEETLPPGALAKLRESTLVGVGQANPDGDKQRDPSQGGALTKAPAGGGSANAQTILPRHQPTVERFFARPKTKQD